MSDSPPRVFISYSVRDRMAVDSVIRALDAEGLDCWVDQHIIRAGADWQNEIEVAMESASVFVLFVSPAFVGSDWAMFEMGLVLGRASASGARVIPVILADAVVPARIQSFHAIDARKATPNEVATKIREVVGTS